MYYDPVASGFRNSLLNSVVAPRPIGWISTLDAHGRANLAPFSYFNAISSTPPMVMFACNEPADRAEKDSLANARATGEFCANLATYALREAMNLTSVTVPHGQDEFVWAGLEKAECRVIRCPRVAASPAALECRVMRIIDFPSQQPGERNCGVVFGRVVGLHIDDELLVEEGRFDVTRAQPIARLGGFSYLRVQELFLMSRPGGG